MIHYHGSIHIVQWVYFLVTIIVPQKHPRKLKLKFNYGLDKLASPWNTLVIGLIDFTRLKETYYVL